MVDLSVNFLGIKPKNPLVVASGILGTSPALMARCALGGAGAVTSKSVGIEPRDGHANPVTLAWQGGVINAIGLTNPGARAEVPLLIETKKRLKALGVPLFASIFAPRAEDFGEVARIIAEAEPDLIEVNISCPNVASDFGTPFSATAKSAAEVTRHVRQAVSIPFSVKLAPNVYNLSEIACAVACEGADAITAINTIPGMLIDPYATKPILKNETGGLSGPAIKPVALRAVWEIAQAVDLPIIGTGGVSSGIDAAEMIMAGARLVGIGSAVTNGGPEVFDKIASELSAFMIEQNYPDLEAMCGLAIRRTD